MACTVRHFSFKSEDFNRSETDPNFVITGVQQVHLLQIVRT